MEKWRHGHGHGKRQHRRFSLIRLPFDHRAYGRLLSVHLLTKKQTEVIRNGSNGLDGLDDLNGLNGLAHLWQRPVYCLLYCNV
jgi:hypothetical protein